MSSTSESIGILSWDYASPKGGMGVSLMRIADQLRGAGAAVTELSPSPRDGKALLPFTRGVGGHLLFSLLLPFTLARRLAGIRLLLLPVGPGGVWLLRRLRVPYAAVVYHTYLQQARCVPGQRWKRVFLPLERRTLRGAAKVLCYCEDTRRVLLDDYGLDNVLLLPHAVEMIESAPAKDETHVVCVARLERRKGVETLLAAWPRIKEAVPHARLTIVGRGAGERAIDARIAALRDVRRLQNLPRADLDSLVARATAAACPAYLEGFGLACAEAMAAGTPVVASDAPGLRGLVAHERTGLLVPPGNAAALADALIRLLLDGSLAARLGSAAQTAVRDRHDPSAAARAIVDALGPLA